MRLKTVITFLYLLVSIPVFVSFDLEPIVWFSFFTNYFLLTIITNYHLNFEKNYSPFLSSFIVFNFLFFIVSPIIQIGLIDSSDSLFPNFYPYNVSNIIHANFLIFLFNLIFFLVYVTSKKRIINSNLNTDLTSRVKIKPLFILTLLIVCILIGFLNYEFLLKEIIKSTYMKSDESVGSLLIKKKVLFMIPLGALIVTYDYLKKKNKITTNTLIAFLTLMALFVILVIFKNPLIEKRNALGPIYITIIFLFYPKVINSNAKFFTFIFVSMAIFFPLVSTLTHVDATFSEIMANPSVLVDSYIKTGGVKDAFSALHYDAFANVMATVNYVSDYGFSYGYQLLSALLFFIPRSVWSSKPISTGELIGDHLIHKFEFGYSNLSNPIVSEGYINFGILGVIAMAILLPYVILKFTNWLNSSDSLKKNIAFYFAVHLMFLLRGDFTNGYSYFIGTFIGVYLIPKFLDYFVNLLFLRRN